MRRALTEPWYQALLRAPRRLDWRVVLPLVLPTRPAELKHVPLKDLCALAGWKTPHVVLTCYHTADETTMREALASRRKLRAGA